MLPSCRHATDAADSLRTGGAGCRWRAIGHGRDGPRQSARSGGLVRGQEPDPGPRRQGAQRAHVCAGPPDGSKRLFVLEREGRVRVADANGQLKPTPFLDVSQNTSTSTEEGMLGLAFDPAFAQNGYVYVDYTANDASVQVVRYTVSPGQPDQVDPATAQTVLAIPSRASTTTAARSPSARRLPVHLGRRRRVVRAGAGPHVGLRQDLAHRRRFGSAVRDPALQSVRESARRAGRDLVLRVPQPVAVQLRSDRPATVDRRRRRCETGGGRFPARPPARAARTTAGR